MHVLSILWLLQLVKSKRNKTGHGGLAVRPMDVERQSKRKSWSIKSNSGLMSNKAKRVTLGSFHDRWLRADGLGWSLWNDPCRSQIARQETNHWHWGWTSSASLKRGMKTLKTFRSHLMEEREEEEVGLFISCIVNACGDFCYDFKTYKPNSFRCSFAGLKLFGGAWCDRLQAGLNF